MDPVRKTVSLVITQNCNLDCVYCYEDHKSKKTMTFERAFSLVESYLSSASTEFDECVIDIFGGEPFTNFPLIRQLCEAVWAQKWQKPYFFSTTTNGTMVHGEIKDWLFSNRHRFYASLSLDGTKEMHDLNRSNSFSKIDIPFFQNTWANPSVKMTISNESLPRLSEGVIFIHSLGFVIHNNFAFKIDWSDHRNINVLNAELQKLVKYYLEHPNIQPCSLLDMKIEYQTNKRIKWCGTGTHMVIYDVDGMDYPCSTFLPMSIGTEKAKLSRAMDFSIIENLTDPKCDECVISSSCPTCYGTNFAESGNITIKNDQICQLTKIRALAVSYLRTKRILENNNMESLEGTDYLTVKAALNIQNKVKVDSTFFANH
jgi:uncharacterized protein